MGLTNPRAITLIVAISTLTSNILSSLLLRQLPDDPYHLAAYCGWYLHFANILSVFGFIGALRQHGPSIALFANYLLVDTLLCALPRFLLPIILQQLSSTLCSPSFNTPAIQNPHVTAQHSIVPLTSSPFAPTSAPSPPSDTIGVPTGLGNGWEGFWNGLGDGMECQAMLRLAQLILVAGAIVATVLQFVGAMCVREYARMLWIRELRSEGCGIGVGDVLVDSAMRREAEERRLSVIYEEAGEKV